MMEFNVLVVVLIISMVGESLGVPHKSPVNVVDGSSIPSSTPEYQVGVAKSDITGPAAQSMLSLLSHIYLQ
jgi:hypothetical protein